jgi:hypothetical protein
MKFFNIKSLVKFQEWHMYYPPGQAVIGIKNEMEFSMPD